MNAKTTKVPWLARDFVAPAVCAEGVYLLRHGGVKVNQNVYFKNNINYLWLL